jgi:hypothetical protein
MMMSGKYCNRAELRKKPRRQFHHLAKIITDGNEPARACTMSDVSHTGARLVLETDAELPNRFQLLLTGDGSARRRCRVVWRAGVTVGVEFANR